MKVELKNVYVAEDGSVFSTESECLEHEQAEVAKKKSLSRLSVYSVSHSFDDTEGRGFFGRTFVITACSTAVIIQWCLDKFGSPLQPWYGSSFFEEWELRQTELSVEEALAKKGDRPFCGHSPVDIVVLSNEDLTWAGLPESEFPWPREQK